MPPPQAAAILSLLVLTSAASAPAFAWFVQGPIVLFAWVEGPPAPGAGDTLTVVASLTWAGSPVTPDSITFSSGLGDPPLGSLTPKADPGIFSGNYTLTPSDAANAYLLFWVSAAVQGYTVDTSARSPILAETARPALSVELEWLNRAQLAPRVLPGDSLSFEARTADNGTAAEADTLNVSVFRSFAPDAFQTDSYLAAARTAVGRYTFNFTVPPGLPNATAYAFLARATLGESTASARLFASVWFYEVVSELEMLNVSSATLHLTVGDGTAAVPGASLTASFGGWLVDPVTVTTDSSGRASISLTQPTDPLMSIAGTVRAGNRTQSFSSGLIPGAPFFERPPYTLGFTAIPLWDSRVLTASGEHAIPVRFWLNGTPLANATVIAHVRVPEGPVLSAANLTTNETGIAFVPVNASRLSPDPSGAATAQLTYFTPSGPQTTSPDGQLWWQRDGSFLFGEASRNFALPLDRMRILSSALSPGLSADFLVEYPESGPQAFAAAGVSVLPYDVRAWLDPTIRSNVSLLADHSFGARSSGCRAGNLSSSTLALPPYFPAWGNWTLVVDPTGNQSDFFAANGRPPAAYSLTLVAPGNAASTLSPAQDLTAPSIDPLADITMDQGGTAQFSASVCDASLGFPRTGSFDWAGSDGATPFFETGLRASHTFPGAGDFTVTFTARDASGHVASRSFSVHVMAVDTTPPVVDAGPDLVLLLGQTAHLSGTATDESTPVTDPAAFRWRITGPGVNATLPGPEANFTFLVEGEFLVTFEVRDARGNVGRDTLTVRVLPPDTTMPLVEAGPDATAFAGEPFLFSGNATDDSLNFSSAARWRWSFVYHGAPVNLYGPRVAFPFDTAGAYRVTLFVTDAAGNVGSDTMLLTVILPPTADTTPPTANAGPDLSAFAGQTLTLAGHATDNSPAFLSVASWIWNFTYLSAPATLYGQSVNYTFDEPGTYLITLSVRDGAGNIGTDNLTATILPKPQAPPPGPGGPFLPGPEAVGAAFALALSASVFGRLRPRKIL